MTFDLAASLLNRAADGNELLQILESIASPDDATAEPTDQEIQF